MSIRRKRNLNRHNGTQGRFRYRREGGEVLLISMRYHDDGAAKNCAQGHEREAMNIPWSKDTVRSDGESAESVRRAASSDMVFVRLTTTMKKS